MIIMSVSSLEIDIGSCIEGQVEEIAASLQSVSSPVCPGELVSSENGHKSNFHQ